MQTRIDELLGSTNVAPTCIEHINWKDLVSYRGVSTPILRLTPGSTVGRYSDWVAVEYRSLYS